ncbi:hypothetical protein ABBQ32_013545 [Trebouxia sp. C0010 RCD-2024]
MHHRELLLSALKYPKAGTDLLKDDANLAALVIWLENTKIRQYSIEERKALSDIRSVSWESSFQQYLDDVQCPIDLQSSPRSSVVDWLLNYAVGLEYQDQAAKFNAAAPKQHKQKILSKQPLNEQHLYADVDGSEVAQALQQLFQKLNLRQSFAQQIEQLQEVRDLVSDQLLPALEDSQLSKAACEAATQLSHLDVNKFPLGFTTGGMYLACAVK